MSLLLAKPQRLRSRRHLAFVASEPCAIRGCRSGAVQAHHLMFAQPRARSLKSGDQHAVPLCLHHHGELHAKGDEESWWRDRGIDALSLAAALWAESVSAGRVRE